MLDSTFVVYFIKLTQCSCLFGRVFSNLLIPGRVQVKENKVEERKKNETVVVSLMAGHY